MSYADRSCFVKISGPGCSKLTTSLVKILLKFQMLILEICHYFFYEKIKIRSFCIAKASIIFFQQKMSVYLVIEL